MRLDIGRDDLVAASQQGHLDEAKVDALWRFLRERVEQDGHVRVSPASGVAETVARASPLGALSFVHVLWFGGALLVLGAMTFFATVGFSSFGGGGLAVIALVYGAAFGAVGLGLWRRADLKVLGGLCVTLAVGMVPLATFGVQKALGWWGTDDPGNYGDFYRWIRGGWFLMEVTTTVAAVLALARVRFSFLVVIPSVALWFMSMDLAELAIKDPSQAQRGWVSVAFGVLMLAIGFALRARARGDLAFWLDTFALLAFQGGLLAQSSDSVVTKIGFVVIQIGVLQLSRVWQRAWPLVVGAVGLFALLGDRIAHNDGAVVLGLVAGTLLFGYGFWVRRQGRSPTATLTFMFVPLFALALTWRSLHDDMLGRSAFCVVAIVLVALAVIARSRLLVAGGGLGLASVIGELAFDVFKDSMVFPLVLASIGIGVMLLGVLLQKHRARIDAALDARMPDAFRGLRVPP